MAKAVYRSQSHTLGLDKSPMVPFFFFFSLLSCVNRLPWRPPQQKTEPMDLFCLSLAFEQGPGSSRVLIHGEQAIPTMV